MSSWWERYPEALERERSELDALGWAWEVDTAAREAGTLAVRVETPSGEGPRRLTAEYPASYPYFPPQVIADLGTFERHQNPVAGTLCLLAREGEEWVPGHDTLAGLLRQQLQDIEEVNRPGVDPEEVAALEDHAAEPLSMFLQYERRSVVLVPDETPPPGVPGGRLELDRLQSAASAENPSPVRAIFRRATDMTGQELVRFDIEVPNRLDPIEGYWIRLLQRPMFSRPDELQSQLLRLAESQNAAFAKAMGRAQKGKVLIVGFVYPDEQSWRQTRDDWLFIALRITVSQKKARRASGVPALLRTDWAGRETLIQRAPYLRPLRDKSALVVGLGTLGSPLALQLARAGLGQLHLLDSDLLQVGNTIRWGTGLDGVNQDGR